MKFYLMTSKVYLKIIKWMIYQIVPDAKYCGCQWCKEIRQFLKDLGDSIAEDY
jgi:hypothetical protein